MTKRSTIRKSNKRKSKKVEKISSSEIKKVASTIQKDLPKQMKSIQLEKSYDEKLVNDIANISKNKTSMKTTIESIIENKSLLRRILEKMGYASSIINIIIGRIGMHAIKINYLAMMYATLYKYMENFPGMNRFSNSHFSTPIEKLGFYFIIISLMSYMVSLLLSLPNYLFDDKEKKSGGKRKTLRKKYSKRKSTKRH